MFEARVDLVSETEDVFENGCVPGTERVLHREGDIYMCHTIHALIDQVARDLKIDKKNITVDEFNNTGFLVSTHRTMSGDVPTEQQKSDWKLGKFRLMLVDYTFSVRKIEMVNFNEMSKEEIDNFGISR